MKKSWFLGVVAVMGLAGTGCAGGSASASMESDGLTLMPVDNTAMSTSFEQSLPDSTSTAVAAPSVEQGLPNPVDSRLAAPADFVVGDAISELHSCPFADPSAATMATAQSLGTCVRGMLAEADHGQNFVFTPVPNVTYTIALSQLGDARFDLGVVSTVDGHRACRTISSDLTATSFRSDGAAGQLCAVVRSQSGASGSYRLTLGEESLTPGCSAAEQRSADDRSCE
ncbi:MAG: hypothetical protein Q8S73_02385 [Deltaproteobacteria bacterium]|nr:hypothetical protein [Myxococcales bacterium]MDP3212925.1 hypothetical protein [Deltaproteobacteria bacterium]